MARSGRPPVERVTVQCAACGAELMRRASDMARNTSGRVFCSKQCQDKVGAKPRRKEERTCRQCGVVFYPRSGGPNNYCTYDCRVANQRKDQVIRDCETCGRRFAPKVSNVANGGGRYCSKDCTAKRPSKSHVGRTHNGKPVRLNSKGYPRVWEPEHPNAARGWVPEHRLVAERAIGRVLTTEEHVHHRNGDKTDNRLENLQLLSNEEHALITSQQTAERLRQQLAELEDLRTEVAEYRRRYGPLT